MLRRPPTSIELKMDDISEYEEMRQKDKQPKSTTELPKWSSVRPKSKTEIQARIGFIPPTNQRTDSN